MSKLARRIQRVSQISNFVGVIFLIPLMLVTTSDVFLRFFFNSPIRGGLEMNQFVMVTVIWLGMAMTTQKKGHIAMQLFESRLSPKTLYYSDIMINGALLMTMAIVNWAIYQRMISAYGNGETTDVLHWPLYPALSIMLIGGIIMVLELFAELYLLVAQGKQVTESTTSADHQGGK